MRPGLGVLAAALLLVVALSPVGPAAVAAVPPPRTNSACMSGAQDALGTAYVVRTYRTTGALLGGYSTSAGFLELECCRAHRVALSGVGRIGRPGVFVQSLHGDEVGHGETYAHQQEDASWVDLGLGTREPRHEVHGWLTRCGTRAATPGRWCSGSDGGRPGPRGRTVLTCPDTSPSSAAASTSR